MDKLLVLTLVAAAMANAALGAEIWLNPANVAVNCEGRVASLRQVGAATWNGVSGAVFGTDFSFPT